MYGKGNTESSRGVRHKYISQDIYLDDNSVKKATKLWRIQTRGMCEMVDWILSKQTLIENKEPFLPCTDSATCNSRLQRNAIVSKNKRTAERCDVGRRPNVRWADIALELLVAWLHAILPFVRYIFFGYWGGRWITARKIKQKPIFFS